MGSTSPPHREGLVALEFGFDSVGTGEPLKVESSERQEQNAV